MRVLLPAVGQTGTTSVVDALRLMGLTAFHNPETLMYAPLINMEDPKPSHWGHFIENCKVDAISLEPQIDAWWVAFISKHQTTKIILTWRNFYSWVRSGKGAGKKDGRWTMVTRRLASGTRVLPWLYMWESLTGGLSRVYAHGIPVSGQVSQPDVAALFVWYTVAKELYTLGSTMKRGTYKMDGEEAYLAHISEIISNVHPDKLLVFDIRKQGWAELGHFLQLPTPRKDTPLPHPRSKNSWTNDEKVHAHPITAFICGIICVAIHIFNCIVIKTVLSWLWRCVPIG